MPLGRDNFVVPQPAHQRRPEPPDCRDVERDSPALPRTPSVPNNRVMIVSSHARLKALMPKAIEVQLSNSGIVHCALSIVH